MASSKKRGLLSTIVKKLSILGFFGFILGCIVITITVWYLSKGLPDVETISTIIPAETTKIYSADGVVLAELHEEENRILIPIEKMSPLIIKSVIALEDTDFYKHHGLNPRGILRALYKDIKARKFVEGGSTLTQQLARNIFLTKHKKIRRKIEEAILAVQIERQYSKDEILEMYLNQVYWGHNAYGIESASRLYFGKSALDLTLGESCMLVGMLQGPELFSPFRNMPRTKQRQLIVLKRLHDLELITQKEMSDAYSQEIVLAERRKFRYKAPFFTSYVVKQLVEMYGEEATFTSGMKVYTTLNYGLQEKATEVVRKYVDLSDKEYWIRGEKVPSLNYNQGAILCMDPRTGYIRVMQGGVDFKSNEFNRITQARRQPGSSFKPFVYLSALQKGFSPGSFIDDSPVTFNTIEGPYSPQNYSRKYRGNLPLRKALELSVNVVAIKLNDLIGPKNVAKVAKQLGIQSNLKPVLSLPLGALEVTMLELASTYGVLANQGIRVEPSSILRIEDRDGTPLYEHQIRETRVFESNLILTLVDMMKGVVKFGTGTNARIPGRAIAGKTGTTSDYKDAWFVGFVPQYVTAVWVGNDDNTPMRNMTGGWMPALMWREFMIEALKSTPAQDFPAPRNLVNRKVDWDTGLLADDSSDPERVTVEKYWRGKEPTEFSRSVSREGRRGGSFGSTSETKDILDFFSD